MWDITGEDHSTQDLAADKRAAIEHRVKDADKADKQQDKK